MIERIVSWSRFFEGPLAVCTGHMLARAAELRLPEPLLRLVIKGYGTWFGVEMTDVLVPSAGFGCFGDFFARRLRPGARPLCSDPGSVASPCDAEVLERGRLDADATNRITIKGTTYSLRDLVGDAGVAAALAGGGYCLLYLHPRDYHRVHVPMDGTLKGVRHLQGARYPMAPWASKLANGALDKNERVAFDIEIRDDGRRCVVLMVAAFGVGGIESPYLPLTAFEAGTRSASPNLAVIRGDELAAFRLGSTVALLWPPGTVEINPDPRVGERVLMGQAVGRICTNNSKRSISNGRLDKPA
jgi:phosphatidylserine decarboxylase